MIHALAHIDAVLDRLPKPPAGTPLARSVAKIERHLLIAKAEIVSLERKDAA